MKNVLIIDGAENCDYSIFAMTEDEFRVAFPGDRQNVEFIEDLVERIGDNGVAALFKPVWQREVKKPDVMGIHGTLFFQLYWKKKFYPTKTDQEMIFAPSEGGTPRRFDVELFIVHPTFGPADISKALGLEARFAHRVGDRRTTPKGTLLPGNYPDTRWRHSVRCSVTEQWYAAEVTRLVDSLEPHKAFFANLNSTGGRASVIIQFLGDGYFGDEIPHATLVKLVDLELALAIECFVDPQSGSL